MRATWPVVRRYALPTLLLGAVAYAAWRAWPMIVPAARVVVTVDVALFVAAAVAETMSYLVLATVLRRLAHDDRLSYADTVQAGLVAVGLGRTLPAAPVEGMVLTHGNWPIGASTVAAPSWPCGSLSGTSPERYSPSVRSRLSSLECSPRSMLVSPKTECGSSARARCSSSRSV